MNRLGFVVAPLRLRLDGLLVAAILTWLLALPLPSAHAQNAGWWFGNPAPYPRRAPRMRRSQRFEEGEARQKGKGSPAVEHKPAGPLFAVLSLSDQHISVYNSSGLVVRSKVSTGMPGHRTPMGIFTIIGRERYHSSNIYSGAPMPFMQRITWSGVAMHLGVVPGYPASHGCIRLPAGSAERLWGLTKIGERVVIAPHEVTPLEFSHRLLPVPKMQASPLLAADNAEPKLTEVAAATGTALASETAKLLNPFEYAQALKARDAADIAAATKALQEQGTRKAAMPEDIRRALTELRAAEIARAQAKAKFAARTETLATKRDARGLERAQAAASAAEAHLADATKKLEAARENTAFQTPEGRGALETEHKLLELRTSLAKSQADAKEAERRLSPISVLVSKKDNRVYIRQALAPVLEAPATIRDHDAPLGTHVYIATSHDDASSLAWTVITYPNPRKSVEETSSRRRRAAAEPLNSAVARAPASPAEALERIELSAEISALISQRLWSGGSLIITDESLSDETSDVGTDLVVTVR
jgi:hypothetical protein